MKLLVDVGNTAVKLALFDKGQLLKSHRNYNHKITKEEISKFLENTKVDEIYLSSVAPKVAKEIEKILEETTNKKSTYINCSFNQFVDINIDNKEELGIDLLCDIVGGKEIYGTSLAIIDFGTATKILFIDKDGVFSSCAIFFGFEASKKILTNSAELLPEIRDNKIKKISECRNTVDVINSTAYYSQIYTIKGIIDKYESEVGYSLKRIITGGNSTFFKDEFKEDIYDEYLLFKGLNILSERN